MVESLMAFAFFGPSKYRQVREYLESKPGFSQEFVEEASCFVRWVVESGKQQMIAARIELLEQMILLVHGITRVEDTKCLFSRLTNAQMEWHILDEYVANFDAMRLGWGAARYAQPGLRQTTWMHRPGSVSNWIVKTHPGLSQEQIWNWMRAAVFMASSRDPAERFFAWRFGRR